jgi:hypothetical protein
LDNTIEDQDIAVGLGFEDENVLIKRFFDMQDLIDLQGHGLTRPLRGDFTEPTI